MSLGVWKGRKPGDSGVLLGECAGPLGPRKDLGRRTLARMESWSAQVWGGRPGGTGLTASLPLSRELLQRFRAWGVASGKGVFSLMQWGVACHGAGRRGSWW